jgi:hypothetical protein
VPRNFLGGKVLPARRADSYVVLFVTNVKGWMEAEHSITPSDSSWPVTGNSSFFLKFVGFLLLFIQIKQICLVSHESRLFRRLF